MKKSIKSCVILPLIAVAGTLASCGNGGGDEETTGKISIDFWHTFGDKPESALQEQVDKFVKLVKDNEGVDVEVNLSYQGAYKDVPSKVNNGMRDGELPTMVIAYADHVANYMEFEGGTPGKYVVDLDKFINDPELTFGTDSYLDDTEDVDDIIQSYLEEGRQMPREGTYLLPYMKSTEIMIYNLSAARVVVPATFPEVETNKVEEFMKTISWEQLMQIAKKAKDMKNIFPTVEYPVYYDSDSNLFITELYQKGIGYSSIGSNGKGVIDFESGDNLAATKSMVTSLLNYHDAGLLTTKGTEGTYASNNFKEMKTLFSIGSTGGTGYTIPASGDFDVGFAKVPTMGTDLSKQKYISQGPSICFLHNPSLSEDANNAKLKYAWKFAKYITSKEVNTELCVSGSEGYSPVRDSCYTTEVYSDFITGGTSYADAALVTQNDINGAYFNSAVFAGSATLREQVGGIITEVFRHKNSVDDAIAAAIENTKVVIK